MARHRNPDPSGRSSEPFVQALMEAALGIRVDCHDDGSRDGMYDLDIRGADGIEPAEVKTDTDSGEMAQHEAFLDRPSPIILQGQLLWDVMVTPEVHLNTAAEALGPVLRNAEARALRRQPHRRWAQERIISEAARPLGVVCVSLRHNGPPGFRLRPAGWGGLAAASERELLAWVENLTKKHRTSISRLIAIDAPRRHFVIVTRFGTPASVQFFMEGHGVPSRAPNVAPGLTDLWIVGGVSGQGTIRWAEGCGWSRVDAAAVCRAWAATSSGGLNDTGSNVDGW